MAERKPSLTRAPERPELDRLLKLNKEQGVSEATIQEQRVSFAYGNAPKGSQGPLAFCREAFCPSLFHGLGAGSLLVQVNFYLRGYHTLWPNFPDGSI